MLCDYFAGWVSGVVALLIGHPLDTIKIQQQVNGLKFKDAAARIKRHRGLKGYYRGIFVPILSSGTLNAVFFGVYGDVRDFLIKTRDHRKWALETSLNYLGSRENGKPMQILIKDGGEINRRMAMAGFEETYHTDSREEDAKNQDARFSELFVSGAAAGLACLVIAAPAELVKTKLQSQMTGKTFKGPIHCFSTILKESGIRGMYRGLMPMALRESFAGGSYFVVYEAIKDKARRQHSSTQTILVQVIGGGLAGVAAWTLILPFDTIKSRMQADNHRKPHYKNMVHCGKEILRTDGLVGLYRGFWSCIARAVPVNAAIFVVYEMIQDRVCNT